MKELTKTFPILVKQGKRKYTMIGHITVKETSSNDACARNAFSDSSIKQELVEVGLRKELEEFIKNKK